MATNIVLDIEEDFKCQTIYPNAIMILIRRGGVPGCTGVSCNTKWHKGKVILEFDHHLTASETVTVDGVVARYDARWHAAFECLQRRRVRDEPANIDRASDVG